MFRNALRREKEVKLGIGSLDLERSSRDCKMVEHLRTPRGNRGGEEGSGFQYWNCDLQSGRARIKTVIPVCACFLYRGRVSRSEMLRSAL